jgi:hypothetical protein
MTKRLEQSRRHGFYDPRFAAKSTASTKPPQAAVTPRRSPRAR